MTTTQWHFNGQVFNTEQEASDARSAHINALSNTPNVFMQVKQAVELEDGSYSIPENLMSDEEILSNPSGLFFVSGEVNSMLTKETDLEASVETHKDAWVQHMLLNIITEVVIDEAGDTVSETDHALGELI